MAGLGWTANSRDTSGSPTEVLALTTSEKCVLEIKAPSGTDMIVDAGHVSVYGLSAGAAARCRIVTMNQSSAGGDAVTVNHADYRIDSGTYTHGITAKRDPTLPTILATHEVAEVTSGWSFGLRSYIVPRGKSFGILALTSTSTATAAASASGTV